MYFKNILRDLATFPDECNIFPVPICRYVGTYLCSFLCATYFGTHYLYYTGRLEGLSPLHCTASIPFNMGIK